jgi:clan AA aspartic protease (TIGR02281 family)
MRFIIISLILILTSLAHAQIKVAMTKKGNVYEVPCKVNGISLNFIFDTGASDVCISLIEASFMLKNGYINSSDILSTEKYQIANGEITEGTKIVIRKLEIGKAIINNVEATVVHSLSSPLLLGQSALQRFGKFSVDYKTLILTLEGTTQNIIETNENSYIDDSDANNKSIVDIPLKFNESIPYCEGCTDRDKIRLAIKNSIEKCNLLFSQKKYSECIYEYNSLINLYPNYSICYL